ncbi:MAG: DUF427 domain-containing protein [Pseudomonadota bacterium]
MSESTIHPVDGVLVVRAKGAVIAESRRAVALHQDGQPPLHFVPREDVAMAFLERSPTAASDTAMGETEYFNIVAKSGTVTDAAWSHPAPFPDLAAIAGFIAFDAEKAAVELL